MTSSSLRIDASEYFRQSFLLSPIPIVVIDLEGEILLSNQVFRSIFSEDFEVGSETNQLDIGRIFEDRETVDSLIADIQARQVIRRREVPVRDHDGNQLMMLLYGRNVEFDGRSAVELSMMEISKQKRLQQSLRLDYARLESLLESIHVGLYLVDRDGVLREANQQLADYLNMDAGELIGSTYQDFFSRLLSLVEEPEVLQQSLERAVMSVNQQPVVKFAMDAENPWYFEMDFFPVWNVKDDLYGWGGLMRDVTDVRERMNWKLEMLSVLSHDIRAPLATLKGQTTALLANFRHWGQEMNTDFLEGINRSTDKLIHQVERNLALTRVEAGQLGLRPEASDLEDILTQAMERISGLLENSKVEVELSSELPQVRVDPARVEEVVINLLENAVRYSPSDKSITIEAQVRDPMMEVSVTDRGPGIPKEEQSGLFDKYTQADRESEGSGLGLYISRKIVEAHGGQIQVESPPEGMAQGAKFTFAVPIMPEKVKEKVLDRDEIEPVRGEVDAESLRILVVEDEPDFQELLRTILSKEGYQVEVAPDGPAAIDIVHTSAPDLILLDWMLPGMSGLSTCRNIRRWTDAPILMVTSRTAQEDLIAALDAGADDYVTKPFNTPELLARIQALARRREVWAEEEPDQITVNGLSINFDTYEVWRSGERVDLTPTEFELLAHLARNRGQVLTYEQLMDNLYGTEQERNRHDLFVHISRLRKKIEPDPEDPRYILTRWGVGYSFETK